MCRNLVLILKSNTELWKFGDFMNEIVRAILKLPEDRRLCPLCHDSQIKGLRCVCQLQRWPAPGRWSRYPRRFWPRSPGWESWQPRGKGWHPRPRRGLPGRIGVTDDTTWRHRLTPVQLAVGGSGGLGYLRFRHALEFPGLLPVGCFHPWHFRDSFRSRRQRTMGTFPRAKTGVFQLIN